MPHCHLNGSSGLRSGGNMRLQDAARRAPAQGIPRCCRILPPVARRPGPSPTCARSSQSRRGAPCLPASARTAAPTAPAGRARCSCAAGPASAGGADSPDVHCTSLYTLRFKVQTTPLNPCPPTPFRQASPAASSLPPRHSPSLTAGHPTMGWVGGAPQSCPGPPDSAACPPGPPAPAPAPGPAGVTGQGGAG